MNDEPVTYWYQMHLGYNMLLTSGIRMLLKRNDREEAAYSQNTFDHMFTCLYDKSCVEAVLSQPNQMRLDAVLTSGLYKIVILEE